MRSKVLQLKIMKKYSVTILAVAFVALCMSTGCKKPPQNPRLSIETIKKIDARKISYEERDGYVFVTVNDKVGDGHIHLLDYGPHSKKEAIDILRAKKEELQEAEQAAPRNR